MAPRAARNAPARARRRRLPRAACARPGSPPLDVVRANAPFFCCEDALSEDFARFEAPMFATGERARAAALMAAWRDEMPARLRNMELEDLRVYRLEAGRACDLRYALRFDARAPPDAARRAAEAGEALAWRGGGTVRVRARLRARLELDDAGRVRSVRESIGGGFGVEATIARYSVLTARRPAGCPRALWYLRVLRHTVVEEEEDRRGGGRRGGCLPPRCSGRSRWAPPSASRSPRSPSGSRGSWAGMRGSE